VFTQKKDDPLLQFKSFEVNIEQMEVARHVQTMNDVFKEYVHQNLLRTGFMSAAKSFFVKTFSNDSLPPLQI
jgi:hypothetical protein